MFTAVRRCGIIFRPKTCTLGFYFASSLAANIANFSIRLDVSELLKCTRRTRLICNSFFFAAKLCKLGFFSAYKIAIFSITLDVSELYKRTLFAFLICNSFFIAANITQCSTCLFAVIVDVINFFNECLESFVDQANNRTHVLRCYSV